MKEVVIIGGGASGLMSAIAIARNQKNVTVIERNNKCGKKLLITGNGKCNFWNENMDISHFHSSNEKLIKDFITEERINSVLKFFDSLGLVYTSKNGYLYPFSNVSYTIQNLLLLECKKLNIQIITDLKVEEIIKKDCFIINPKKENIKAKNIVLATGSIAYPKTGSDGIGYEIARSFNHNIIKPLPSLIQLKAEESYLKKWSGIRVEATASIYINDKLIKQELGTIQLTNYGLSGICIFNLSRLGTKAIDKKQKVDIEINFMPFTNNPKDYLKKLNQNTFKKEISQLLEGFIHYKLVPIILNKASLKENLLLDNLTEKEINRLINALTHFKINIKKSENIDHAQVCQGGIPLSEINSKTLESKKVKNLYFVGEIIDIDGDCGGYNLGWAWMSALTLGKSVK